MIGVKPPGRPFEYATEQTRIDADDVLILSGDTMLLEKFARRP